MLGDSACWSCRAGVNFRKVHPGRTLLVSLFRSGGNLVKRMLSCEGFMEHVEGELCSGGGEQTEGA